MWRLQRFYAKKFRQLKFSYKKNASQIADDLACIFIDIVDLYNFVSSYCENLHVW